MSSYGHIPTYSQVPSSAPEDTMPPINNEQLKTVLGKVQRLAAKLQCVTDDFQREAGQGSPMVLEHDEYTDYCKNLVTVSTSLNRLIYLYDHVTGIDPVDLVAAKRGKLSAKVPPAELQAICSSIEIRKFAGCITIYLPYIPGRKQIERQFISELLFQRLLDEGPYPCWPQVHILFTHVYPQSLTRLPKDVDNFNYKPIIDYLAAALRFSDAAPRCSLEMRSEFRDDLTAGAYIQVFPQRNESTLASFWGKPALAETE